jgi:hypothetical protein
MILRTLGRNICRARADALRARLNDGGESFPATFDCALFMRNVAHEWEPVQ